MSRTSLSRTIFSIGVLLGSLCFLPAVLGLSASFPKTDAVITAQVQIEMRKDPHLSGLAVSVDTRSGIVYFSGDVRKEDLALSLVKIANSIAGTKGVNVSQLKVAGSHFKLGDNFILAQIAGLYKQEGLEDPTTANIKIEVHKGKVTLSGTVITKDIANSAINLAQSVDGVTGVDSKLTVLNTPKKPKLPTAPPSLIRGYTGY